MFVNKNKKDLIGVQSFMEGGGGVPYIMGEQYWVVNRLLLCLLCLTVYLLQHTGVIQVGIPHIR